MENAMGTEGFPACNEFLGPIEYYESILKRKDLTKREAEFRNHKLGLTLDLLRLVDIPENLKSELSLAIINAWRLVAPEKTLAQREDELFLALRSLEAVRGAIRWVRKHPGPRAEVQLCIAVMFALPLMPSDLGASEVPRVHDLLTRVMDYFAAKMGNSNIPGQMA